jgi:hypothetical protein
VLTSATAMLKDVGIIAARVFQGVGENGHAIKGTVVVDGLS